MKKFLKNKKIVCISIIIFLIGMYIISNKFSNNYDEEIITEENIVQNEVENEEIDVITEEIEENISEVEQETEEKIYVYVTGQVNIPGVVILDKGSRIIDAINAAGGTTNKASTTKINLVYVLEDGMKVNVPSIDELKNDSNFEYITKDSGDGANDPSSENSADSATASQKERNSNIVNINTATQTELETLPGIGPSTALKIINYRKENGKFSNIEELKNVNGIGDNKFESLKKYITV